MIDEGEVLTEVLRKGLPCTIELANWNEAVSLQARLSRYIRDIKKISASAAKPFEGLEITVIHPQFLRFKRRSELKFFDTETK
jgi:hypothetical protein